MNLNMRINTKMLVFILSTTLLIYAVAIGFISISARKTTFNDAKKIVEAYAKENAQSIEKQLSEDMAKMRTFAESFKNYKTIPDSERLVIVKNLYEGVFKANPQFYGLWDSWELSVTEPGWELPYGRTVEEYWREGGIIHNQNSKKSMDGDNADYARIKKGRVEVVEEPYLYSYTGEKEDELLMTSLIAPIISDGVYVGVVGVDIVLESFQELVRKIQPYQESEAYLVSNAGFYIGHPQNEWIGKTIDEQYENFNDEFNIIPNIKEGKKFSFIAKQEGMRYFYAFAPIHIGKVTTPWSLGIKVPVYVITEEANRKFFIAIFIGLAGLIILTTIIWLISRNISIPLIKTTKILEVLSTGNVKDIIKIDVRNKDEIGQMANSVNRLIDGLRSTSDFANEIGEGNLNAEFTPLSEEDTLGNSLIQMRKSLIHAENEEQKRKEEEQIQKWITEGIAKFGEILRSNNDNIQKLSFQIMSALINYLNANQGALFILNDADENDIYFEQMSAIAYDRNKMLERKIRIGEELVGRCAHEKLTIYLKKVPDDYIEITSGMGTANPKEILIVPVKLADVVYGVIEMASFNEFKPYQIEFVEKIGETIASTISSVKINAKTARLLEQSQQQAEELAAQEEEMRQNLEELQATQEESGRREFEMQGLIQALSSSTFTIEYDMKGKITNINDPFLKLIGMSREQVIGMYHKDGIDFSDQTPEEYEKFWDDLNEGMHKKVINKIDYHGNNIWLSETYSPILDADGKPYKVLKIAFDITELKEKENLLEKQKSDLVRNEEELQNKMDELTNVQLQLKQKEEEQVKQIKSLNAENEKRLERFANKEAQSRAILEANPSGIVIFDEHGIIEFFNTAAQKLWNYSAADVIGIDIYKLIPGVLELLASKLEDGKAYSNIILNKEEIEIVLADGSTKKTEYSVFVNTITGRPRYTAFINGNGKDRKQEIKKQAKGESKVKQSDVKKSKPKREVQTPPVQDSDIMHIVWESIYKTEINEIDEQHKKISELINRLIDAFNKNRNKKEIKDTLKSLVDYTAYHFGTEENYFETFGYANEDEHKKLHKAFMDNLSEFVVSFDKGKTQISAEFISDTAKWFISHFEQEDSKYENLFKEKGVK